MIQEQLQIGLRPRPAGWLDLERAVRRARRDPARVVELRDAIERAWAWRDYLDATVAPLLVPAVHGTMLARARDRSQAQIDALVALVESQRDGVDPWRGTAA